jgi:predicted Rossmann fold nucleotide-binding protein DprA/Smf involved in DNA uptake
MKKLQNQLAWISQTLTSLSKHVSQITKQVGKLTTSGKAKPARGPAKKTPGRVARVRRDTVLDAVYDAIKRSRNGISIAQLKKKTDLGDRQLSNALYKLTKKGVVYAKSRGVYVKS